MQLKRLVSVLGIVVVVMTIAASGSAFAAWTIDSTQFLVRWWTSSHTANLSGWRTASCWSTHGANYLPTRLRAWREPSANLDNFIAKLTVRCTDYRVQAGSASSVHWTQTDDYDWETVYAGNFRDTSGYTSKLRDFFLPIGLRISTNLEGTYVKDIRLFIAAPGGAQPSFYLQSYASPSQTTWALNNGAHNYTRSLFCPDQYVVTGLALKYSTQNGKIRQLKAFCRRMTWD